MAEVDTKGMQDAISEMDVVYNEYMQVVMNGEPFLVAVNAILSILRPVPLTPVLMAPDHLMGVANIRGQIFCLVDPGKALGLRQARKEKTGKSRFLLLRHARVHLGIWVEEVMSLHRVVASDEKKADSQSYVLGRVDTEVGELPVLRVDALFD